MTPSKTKWTLQARPGGWWVAESPDGIRKRWMVTTHRNRWSANVGGRLCSGVWASKDRDLSDQEADQEVVAQFPGKVRKILVMEGSAVVKGDSLFLVEAMKMEFTIRAPFSGRVTRLLVKEEQQLSPGDSFLEWEAIQNGE